MLCAFIFSRSFHGQMLHSLYVIRIQLALIILIVFVMALEPRGQH